MVCNGLSFPKLLWRARPETSSKCIDVAYASIGSIESVGLLDILNLLDLMYAQGTNLLQSELIGRRKRKMGVG